MLLPLALLLSSVFAAPAISSFSLQPEQPISPTTIALDLSGATAATAVTLEVCLDGDTANWRPLRLLSPGPYTVTPGQTQLLSWDASKDVGFHARNGTLRVTPDGGAPYTLDFTIPYAEILRRAGRAANHHLVDYGTHSSGHYFFSRGKWQLFELLHVLSAASLLQSSSISVVWLLSCGSVVALSFTVIALT